MIPLPSPITTAELISAQCADDFFKMTLDFTVAGGGKVFEDTYGVLVRPHPDYEFLC